jgi:predicted nucleic acid-binding protein
VVSFTAMLYIDTSSFLKPFLLEPEASAVDGAIEIEDQVVVTPLTLLECETQLRAMLLGGRLTKRTHQRIRERVDRTVQAPPFNMCSLSGRIFALALQQHQSMADVHCRTLDRLHLAAMEELGIRRLMTHDHAMAVAARALGYVVLTPR